MTLMVPHTLYGIGIWWSPLPYMEQVLYGPPTCTIWWSPLTLYGTHIIWPPTCMYGTTTCMIWCSLYLILNRYHMVPHVYVWSPHVYDLMVSPYLKWNRCHMVPPHVCMVPYMHDLMSPHTLYGTGIVRSPHMYDMTFQASSKESTAHSNEVEVKFWNKLLLETKMSRSAKKRHVWQPPSPWR